MKDLKFICAQPDDTYYVWQVHLWLESLRKINHSDKAIVLVFTPKDRTPDFSKWERIAALYPEAEFAYYKDEHNITDLLGIYIPILRPYVLWRYFKDHPVMVSKAVFYCDCDIIFTDKFNVDHLKDDEINYVSDTNSYINARYFDSKVNDVLPDKLEEYKTRDVLSEITSMIGITREVCESHNDHSGGAQYFLKNIDAAFWNKMMTDTITIRSYLLHVNKTFFENENKGFQSWCADMWGVLWNLWFREVDVQVVPEMNFAWACDMIQKLDTYGMYHNAGISGELFKESDTVSYPCFYKGKYHAGRDPFKDTQLEIVLNNEETKKHCNWYYANALRELYDKYQLNY